MHELKLMDVQKKYKDKEAVRKFNYTFTNGVYGLLGENGAGKTTLMRLICGVLQPTGGSIYCDDIEIDSMGAEYRRCKRWRRNRRVEGPGKNCRIYSGGKGR